MNTSAGRMSRVPEAESGAWPDDDTRCRRFQPVIELVGKRWVGLILLAGVNGARRFRQYRASVPGISDRVLTQRLKELERHQLIVRTVTPTTPVTIHYRPTPEGAELLAALQPLIDFGNRHPGLAEITD